MNVPRKIFPSLTILLFLVISSYPFMIFQLNGKLQFISQKADDLFQWTLFFLWSLLLWILGYWYNKLSTADIRLFITAVMAVVATAILFCSVATHFFGYGNDEEKILYESKKNKRKRVVQRFHGAGAIGSDYYNTIKVYQLLNWVRYQDEFRLTNFDSTKKHQLKGCWSGRINKEHRLVYFVNEQNDVEIISCKGYYEQQKLRSRLLRSFYLQPSLKNLLHEDPPSFRYANGDTSVPTDRSRM